MSWLARRARTESWLAAGLCLSLLAVPIAEEHQFVLLGIPAALVLRGHAALAAPDRTWWPWLLVAGLILVPLDYTAHSFTGGWSALAAYPRLYAAWLLWAISARHIYVSLRDNRVAGDGPAEAGHDLRIDGG